MAERDQLGCSLACHDACNAGCPQHVSLFGIAAQHQTKRLGRHDDSALGHCNTFCCRFRRHIHHACFAARGKMTELWHHSAALRRPCGRLIKARVAASTSRSRMRLSPTKKVEMPNSPRDSRSAWEKIPLSLTI